MPPDYPWYQLVPPNEDLLQGDFVDDCALVNPSVEIDTDEMEGSLVEAEVLIYDVIILSQSCDLVEKKVDLVLVCPVWSFDEAEKSSKLLRQNKGKEHLRQGRFLGYHLLNRCDIGGFEKEYLVVDFRSVYSIPFESIVSLTRSRGERLRLLPPYREHLSQAFARFFMRVGLPVDIPPFN